MRMSSRWASRWSYMELVVETALLHTVAISRNVSWMPQPLRELMIASSSSTRQLVFVLLGLVTLQHRRAARVPPDKRRLVARGAGPSGSATIECGTHHRTYTSSSSPQTHSAAVESETQ